MGLSKQMIPYGRQWIDETDINAVIDVLTSDYLTTGPKVGEFEKVFAEYVGAKYAVAISNGTAALHAACYAAGIKEGDEVITTPITFAASANCVLYCGATPVFADIDPKTYNIDPKDIRNRITNKTKAIIAVDYTGQPCDFDAIYDIAKEYNLIVIEDAAHSLGASYKGKKVGSIADVTTFSFHPVKHITTGEGGMITTNDKNFYDRLMIFRGHGITRDKDLMHNKDEGAWYYEQLELGYNYRMTDIQCALGMSQLKKIDTFIERRKKIVERYNQAFKTLGEIITPFQMPQNESSWHLYVVQLNLDKLKITRKEIFEILREKGIGVNVHYIPVYYFPYYKKMGYKKGICPQAEVLYEGIITLPLFPKMLDEEVGQVITSINDIISRVKR
jgi:UDP-4-amino-4,6-dideoxy-N-acetyl-beta-L-altrosamine transaminase